jgi:16S rRNA G1207 methylase RsmC
MEKDKKEIFAQINSSMEEKQEYIENILGYDFVCHPDVFSPKYFASTQVFNSGFPFKQNEHFLEIGPGIGVTSVLAAKSYNNKVVCIDINPTAVRITDINANRHNVRNKVDARQGDLFQL